MSSFTTQKQIPEKNSNKHNMTTLKKLYIKIALSMLLCGKFICQPNYHNHKINNTSQNHL